MHKYFAIIPARKNSKGIKRKNLVKIGSKPMIQFTFESALKSKLIDYLILSSDDPDSIALANKLNIATPFIRPDNLSLDDSKTSDVIMHALQWYSNEFSNYPKNVIVLQPTSPFRNEEDIDRAIEKYEKTGADSLVSACEASQHPSECVTINEKNNIQLIKLNVDKNKYGRQSYDKAYFIDGGIYITTSKKIIKDKVFFDEKSELYFSKKSHAIDIDDPFDLELARAMFEYSKKSKIMEI